MPPAADSEALADGLVMAARRLRSAAMTAFAAYDVTPSQVRAVRVLTTHGSVRASELAQHLHIAPRSATEVVDALEAKGLVARTPDPHDRRATLVGLTEAGCALSEEVRRARGVESARMFDPLTKTDRADLARVLRKLSAEQP